jgi:ammonium transporter, Amt family
VPFDFHSVDTGATAWVLASGALVLLMTPGLAFFYSGMVRAKHALAMLMQNYVTIGIVSLAWVVCGFSLAFGEGNGFIGDFRNAGLQHMGDVIPGYVDNFAQVIPPMVFVIFQLMFAVITPALITGSTADRWKFGAFVPFITLWSILVYSPVAHWVFSPEGWLFKKGALDFAGGTVVHINAGIAGLALAIFLGKRRGWPSQPMRPHNVPFVLLGAGLLWFGWFGFNAGSALGANQLAGYAFVNTNTATAVALLAWIGVEKLRDGKATTLGAASGAVAGLVAITPCAGFISPLGAIAVGAIAGGGCALAVALKGLVRIDDSLDVVAVHLIGGILGSLCVGLFATVDTNPLGADGLFYGGGWSLLGKQALAVVSVIAYTFVMTMVIAFLVNLVIKMRVPAEVEDEGLDYALHGETAYEFSTLGGSPVSLGAGAQPKPGPERAPAHREGVTT